MQPFCVASSLDPRDELEVLLEVLALEARRVAAEVVRREVVELLDLAGEKAAAERAVRDEADAELATRREDAVLRIARPQRVLGLQRGDRMDLARAAQRLDAGLRQAEVADLAGLHEVGHRADRVLDRRARVDAVLVVEVDVIDAEPLQARVARRLARTRACR